MLSVRPAACCLKNVKNGVVILGSLLVLTGCDAINPQRPTPQPDIKIFGNLLEVTPSPEEPGTYTVQVKVGPPRALSAAKEGEGEAAPTLEQGALAEITVNAETVVMLDRLPTKIEAFNPGAEVVVAPVPGTTFMVGASKVLMEASFFLDFNSYRLWKLPNLEVEGAAPEQLVEDASLINTSGVEHSPVPVAGGKVLYFSARLRPGVKEEQQWIGARRDGLPEPEGEQVPLERVYRSELTADGWTQPELVQLPGIDDAWVVRLTWIDEEETSCLLTVQQQEQGTWVGRSTRKHSDATWSPVERLQELGEGYAADATYLAGSTSMIAFVSTGVAVEGGDLYLLNPKKHEIPMPLDPSINTPGDEWSPRVGPDNELFFCRGEQQLLLKDGQVRSQRFPTGHRALITEANPTRDGKWIFFCLPKLTPVDIDQNIWVAPLQEDLSMGEAVPVDEWRLP